MLCCERGAMSSNKQRSPAGLSRDVSALSDGAARFLDVTDVLCQGRAPSATVH